MGYTGMRKQPRKGRGCCSPPASLKMAPKSLKKNKILTWECKDTTVVLTQSRGDGPAGLVLSFQVKERRRMRLWGWFDVSLLSFVSLGKDEVAPEVKTGAEHHCDS